MSEDYDDLFASCTDEENDEFNRRNALAAEREKVLDAILEQLHQLSADELRVIERRLRLRVLRGGLT